MLRQLRHDHRTIAMLLVLPSVLLGLLYLLWKDLPTLPGQPGIFDRVGLIMLGIFPFVIMFLVTSIAMLRERTSGTLERLLTTPLGRLDLLLGYGIAFGLAAAAAGPGHGRRRDDGLRPRRRRARSGWSS